MRAILRDTIDGRIKLEAKEGELPAVFYPEGWIERAAALERGEAVALDWDTLA